MSFLFFRCCVLTSFSSVLDTFIWPCFCFIFENLSLNRFRSLSSSHYSGFSHTFINIVFSTDACTFCNISCSGKVIDKVVFKLLLQMLYKSYLSLKKFFFFNGFCFNVTNFLYYYTKQLTAVTD